MNHINELSYRHNIGAMETFKFYSIATPEQKQELKKLLADKKYKQGWDLIQSVTGIKLQNLGTKMKTFKEHLAEATKIVVDGSVLNVHHNGNFIGNIFPRKGKPFLAYSKHMGLKREHKFKKDAVDWLVQTHETLK